MRNISFSLEDMLIECTLGGIKCDVNDFTHYSHPTYYSCYTLNSSRVIERIKNQVSLSYLSIDPSIIASSVKRLTQYKAFNIKFHHVFMVCLKPVVNTVYTCTVFSSIKYNPEIAYEQSQFSTIPQCIN